MANQYCGSFEHKVQQRFGLTAEEFLRQCVEEGLTYSELEKKTGFTKGTLRKWAGRFELSLNPGCDEKAEDEFAKFFSDPNMNVHNFLSRQWGDAKAEPSRRKVVSRKTRVKAMA